MFYISTYIFMGSILKIETAKLQLGSTVRKNPYRNQVRVTISRLHGGINTKTDNKRFLATVQTKWPDRKNQKNRTERIDYSKISDTVKKEECKVRAQEIHLCNIEPVNNQQR